MKRITVVLGLAVLIAVFVAGPVSAKAVTETNVQTFPLLTAVEDCDGTETVVQSTLRFVTHSTTDAQGGTHEFITESIHGVTATDVNGEKVIFSSHHYEGRNTFAVPRTATIADSAVIISSGPSDNRSIRQTFHFTITPDGEVAIFRHEITVECPG
jgi:hypothetical protein